MKEVILCKYGEIILKGANKSSFESALVRQVRRRAKKVGEFNVRYAQSTVYVEPLCEDDDEAAVQLDAMYEEVKCIFGFASVTRAAVCEKNMEAILDCAAEYLPSKLSGVASFRCEAKRSDKRFPLKSPEIAAEVGGRVLEKLPRLKVDLTHPDITVRVEVRESAAYIHAGQDRGAGGIPVGTGGKGLLLLSGGIDSPVAGHMMARRGLSIDALHFESFPYTSERAREKVLELAHILCRYCESVRVHIISLTHIQEEIRDKCEEDYFTLILRRFMMELADMCAAKTGARALITGESLGQVASQTLAAINVTDIKTSLPVFRPCIGLDKEEIVERARAIGTFDTSVLPFEDCCTVFTPRHPRTRPELEKVEAQEAALDRAALIAEAFETEYTVSLTDD